MLPWLAGWCRTREGSSGQGARVAQAQATLPPSLGFPPQLLKYLPPVVGGGASARAANQREEAPGGQW